VTIILWERALAHADAPERKEGKNFSRFRFCFNFNYILSVESEYWHSTYRQKIWQFFNSL